LDRRAWESNKGLGNKSKGLEDTTNTGDGISEERTNETANGQADVDEENQWGVDVTSIQRVDGAQTRTKGGAMSEQKRRD
jgi:hypothetical protein